MLDCKKMTLSALERYVRICETVFQSDAFLHAQDRLELVQDLIAKPGNPTPAEIESACAKLADENLGQNMVAAQVLRSAFRG